jgi:hypothetical protein
LATTRLSLAEAFGEPPQEDAWNPYVDAEYVTLGHIQAEEFNRRLAASNGWTVDPASLRHAWFLLDRHELGCPAPQPASPEHEYDDCGCTAHGDYAVTDVVADLPVHFREISQSAAERVGAIEVTYAVLAP